MGGALLLSHGVSSRRRCQAERPSAAPVRKIKKVEDMPAQVEQMPTAAHLDTGLGDLEDLIGAGDEDMQVFVHGSAAPLTVSRLTAWRLL